jgi:hypothetical protein
VTVWKRRAQSGNANRGANQELEKKTMDWAMFSSRTPCQTLRIRKIFPLSYSFVGHNGTQSGVIA